MIFFPRGVGWGGVGVSEFLIFGNLICESNEVKFSQTPNHMLFTTFSCDLCRNTVDLGPYDPIMKGTHCF